MPSHPRSSVQKQREKVTTTFLKRAVSALEIKITIRGKVMRPGIWTFLCHHHACRTHYQLDITNGLAYIVWIWLTRNDLVARMCGTEECRPVGLNLRGTRFMDEDPSGPSYRGRDFCFTPSMCHDLDRNSDKDTGNISELTKRKAYR